MSNLALGFPTFLGGDITVQNFDELVSAFLMLFTGCMINIPFVETCVQIVNELCNGASRLPTELNVFLVVVPPHSLSYVIGH